MSEARSNRKSTPPWKHVVMEKRRVDAEERQAAHDLLTPQQKLAKLDKGDLAAEKERAKLKKAIAEAKR